MFDCAKTAGRSRAIVREYAIKELYPTDTPEFEVGVITVFTHKDSWWAYLDTTLPDDTLYRVSWPVEGGEHEVIAYKKIEV